MPMYDYKCSACNAKFEELVSTSTTQVKCPKCGSTETTRMLSLFAAKSSGGGPTTSFSPPSGGHSCNSFG